MDLCVYTWWLKHNFSQCCFLTISSFAVPNIVNNGLCSTVLSKPLSFTLTLEAIIFSRFLLYKNSFFCYFQGTLFPCIYFHIFIQWKLLKLLNISKVFTLWKIIPSVQFSSWWWLKHLPARELMSCLSSNCSACQPREMLIVRHSSCWTLRDKKVGLYLWSSHHGLSISLAKRSRCFLNWFYSPIQIPTS